MKYKHGPLPEWEPDRTEHEWGPPTLDELRDWTLWVQAIVVIIAAIMFLALATVVCGGPKA